MKNYNYKDLVIEIFVEDQYKLNSTDNKSLFDKIYDWFTVNSIENKYSYNKIHYRKDLDYKSSVYGVKIYQNEKEIDNCLIVGAGASTGIYENSTILDEDKLLICCCDSVFCLGLPDLNLIWQTQADDAACFNIFKLEETYIVHGELLISRIDKNGELLWQFGGRDIFVTIVGEDVFEIHSDHILVSDFNNDIYKIDLDGNSID